MEQVKVYFEKLKAWIIANKAVSIIGGIILLFVLYKKFGRKSYRRRRRLPRSVGMRRRNRANKPSVNRVIKSGRNRGKKAWQIKGSEAARRHMAAIRRKRANKLF